MTKEERKEKKKVWDKNYKNNHKKEVKQRQKQWYDDNKDNVKQYQKDNKDKINKRRKQYQKDNKEELKTKRKKYIDANIDKIRKYAKDYRAVTKEERKKYDMISRNKKRYGITPEQYTELFNKQEGKCAICGKHQTEFKKALCVDHNHITGKIRGLLCYKCNTGIGNLNDNIILLQNAINYIKDND